MKKFLAITLAVLTVLCILTIPAYAGEVTDVMEDTVPVTETVMETETEAVTEAATEITTETSEETESAAELTETDTYAETETSVPFDEWLYGLMQEASPEQLEMIEEIVLGGVGALDKLGIKGFDRVRIWVEHNTATVMVVALIVALVCFIVAEVIVKKTLCGKTDRANDNAIEIYEAGQEAMAKSEKVCTASVEAAEAAAEEAKKAVGMVTEERSLLINELDRNAKVTAALCETINFLMQCSDLSRSKRDEAEAIYKKAQEAMSHDHTDEA